MPTSEVPLTLFWSPALCCSAGIALTPSHPSQQDNQLHLAGEVRRQRLQRCAANAGDHWFCEINVLPLSSQAPIPPSVTEEGFVTMANISM